MEEAVKEKVKLLEMSTQNYETPAEEV